MKKHLKVINNKIGEKNVSNCIQTGGLYEVYNFVSGKNSKLVLSIETIRNFLKTSFKDVSVEDYAKLKAVTKAAKKGIIVLDSNISYNFKIYPEAMYIGYNMLEIVNNWDKLKSQWKEFLQKPNIVEIKFIDKTPSYQDEDIFDWGDCE